MPGSSLVLFVGAQLRPPRDPQLAMDSVVVGANECADRTIETGKIQDRRRCPAAGSEEVGKSRQKLGVNGAEEPLDLPSSLGSADGRVDDPDVQGDRGPFNVVADEVGAVV